MSENLPNALVIGPMKAGTTWIQEYLESRGDICLPRGVKETFFFDRHWHRGKVWYADRFNHSDAEEKSLCLEVAPSYFHNPEVPERVYQTLGEIPLLVTLRDPVKRAWSHYLHLQKYGYTKASLQTAVREHPDILEASRYRTCLQRWYAFFPESKVHFVWQELLACAPEEYVQAVCQALGAEFKPFDAANIGRVNEGSIPSSHFLAAMGRRTSFFLRDKGCYGLVNIAKSCGLKQFFFGKPGSAKDIQPSREEWEWLSEQLENEMPQEIEMNTPSK